jgi:hypothetical protein
MTMLPLRLDGLIAGADMPAMDAPVDKWTVAQEVTFREKFAGRVRGNQKIYGLIPGSRTPLHIRNLYTAGLNYWIYGNQTDLFVVDGAGVHSAITDAGNEPAVDSPNEWTSCELNGLPVFNYGKEPVFWAGSTGTDSAPLPGWPANTTCKVIRAFKNFLFALNVFDTQELPSLARWSDSAEPGTVPTEWAPSANNNAGEFSLGNVGEGITDGLVLRDYLMVYKPHSAYLIQLVGGNAIFSQRQVSSSYGCLASNCVAELGGKHIGLGEGDVWITDGNNFTSLVSQRVRNDLFARIDPTYFRNSYVVAYPLQNEVWICVPEIGNEYATLALVWNSITNQVAYRALTFGTDPARLGCPHMATGNRAVNTGGALSWLSYGIAWQLTPDTWNFTQQAPSIDGLVGSYLPVNGTTLLLVDAPFGTEDVLTGKPMVLGKYTMDLGERDRVKYISEVWPRIIGQAGYAVNIRVGSQMEPEDAIVWNAFQPYILGTTKKIDCRITARFMSIEVQTDQFTQTCRVTGFDVNAQLTGRY